MPVTFDPGNPPDDATTDDHVLAAWLAEAAGRRLLEVRGEGLEGRELKDAGDRAAHELLMTLLAEHRPADAVLSEEGEGRQGAAWRQQRVWIVDPLDGTREFSEVPRDDWAVHVALWQARRPDRRGGGPAGARRDVQHRAPRRSSHPGPPNGRGSRSRAAARRRSCTPSPRSSTPSWCRWARPG